MKTEPATLSGKKETLLVKYRAARSQAQEYEIIRKSVDALLSVPKQSERELSNTCHSL